MTTKDPSVLLVRRVEFDHAIVRAAEHAGATLVERFEITQAESTDTTVTLKARDGRRLTAPFVVAADGVHSVLAKRLGVNQKWPAQSLAIDMMEETPVATLRAERPDVLWVAYAYNGLDGYAYVFPKTHHVNVGIGCLLSHFKGEVPERPYTLQDRRSCDRSSTAGVLHGQSDRRHFTPFLIPVGGPLPRADARARVVRGRCRRLRQRVHRGRDLLRDGVGRAGGPGAGGVARSRTGGGRPGL